ncbi:MAG: 2-amino-4-hydroxy-6-hydroxymethyldihydropteridine diphosphokinase [Actinobacteria bacterium]|uniref:2-amino-4-hydroxy-6-hydroxymethyldihydropteridine diphosphokinase n=1 Tax=freshwater metagenome TaxID=449393 RepID=A0A6J6F7X3_9ZZZZ|nr:2-amino-4-hydroxy-6-hydroxymethyldihydropteridine diphosphokinase [Actinomycetota bacterium]
MKVVIALGSNIGESAEILESAVNRLNNIITVTHLSSFIETEPVGGPEQPNYLNAVLIGESELQPLELLHAMLAIETELGRAREVRWGPRTLDLDLIVAGESVMKTPELELPHPRAHERAFVLEPWLEIDPDANIPGKGSVYSLLSELHLAE